MKGKIFSTKISTRDINGEWSCVETFSVCLGGQIHVKHRRTQGKAEEHEIEEIGPCDGSCHKTIDLSPEVEEAVKQYIENGELPHHPCVTQESEDVFLINLPDGCTPGRVEAVEAFIEAVAWLKLMHMNSRFSIAAVSSNTDAVTAWVATRI